MPELLEKRIQAFETALIFLRYAREKTEELKDPKFNAPDVDYRAKRIDESIAVIDGLAADCRAERKELTGSLQ